jgi:hypothetical protein
VFALRQDLNFLRAIIVLHCFVLDGIHIAADRMIDLVVKIDPR